MTLASHQFRNILLAFILFNGLEPNLLIKIVINIRGMQDIFIARDSTRFRMEIEKTMI